MRDEPDFKRAVERLYVAAGSWRGDDGGWDSAELLWPSSRAPADGACDFDELQSAQLRPEVLGLAPKQNGRTEYLETLVQNKQNARAYTYRSILPLFPTPPC